MSSYTLYCHSTDPFGNGAIVYNSITLGPRLATLDLDSWSNVVADAARTIEHETLNQHWTLRHDEPGRCSTCGAEMVWALTLNNKPIPLDPEPYIDGNLRYTTPRTVAVIGPLEAAIYADELRFKTHFATCKDADHHRKGTT